jgi:hypothetical protein
VAVEVAAGAVVVLGGAGVGVAGEYLRVARRHAGVEGVGDRGVPQGVRTDMTAPVRYRARPGPFCCWR